MKFIMKSAGINLKGSDAEKLINISELCRTFNINVNSFNTLRHRYGYGIEETLAIMLASNVEEE